jgi:hypothetical protein
MSDINMSDIKKAYLTKAAPKPVTLCYSGKEILLRPIKIRDKKEFLKVLEGSDETAIDAFADKLIEKYAATDDEVPIDAKKLVDQERQQILTEIRKNSTEFDYASIDHVCSACGKTNVDVKFPFTNITTKFFKEPEQTNVIVSKNGDVSFAVGLLSRGDNLEIEKYIKDSKVTSEVEKNFIFLASTIKAITVSIDDVKKEVTPSIKERVEFAESLTLDDFERIKNYFAQIKGFGTFLEMDFTCVHCQQQSKDEVKFIDFFIK